jgi:hypothetical protein
MLPQIRENFTMKRNNIEKILIILSIFWLAVCLLLLLPQTRQIVIMTAEQIPGHELRDRTKWFKFLSSVSFMGIVLFSLLSFPLLMTKRGEN